MTNKWKTLSKDTDDGIIMQAMQLYNGCLLYTGTTLGIAVTFVPDVVIAPTKDGYRLAPPSEGYETF